MDKVMRTIRVWADREGEAYFEVVGVARSGRRGIFVGVEKGVAVLYLGGTRRMECPVVEGGEVSVYARTRFLTVLMPARGAGEIPSPYDGLH